MVMAVEDDRDPATGRLLLVLHSGTYGRVDDVSGALILASSLMTDGTEVTILLRGDGVFLGLGDQDPNEIGLENNLEHLESAVEMGVRVLALSSSMEERGLGPGDLVEYIEVLEDPDLPGLVSDHQHWVPF